jgi:hypothetical protein
MHHMLKRARYSKFRIITGRVGLFKILETVRREEILSLNSVTTSSSSNKSKIMRMVNPTTKLKVKLIHDKSTSLHNK